MAPRVGRKLVETPGMGPGIAGMSDMTSQLLGVLDLANDNESGEHPVGALRNRRTFHCPVLVKKVPGAWASEVLAAEPALEQSYVRLAKQLEAEGATAITAHCGYSIVFQSAVAAAVSVPTGLSALMQLPMLKSMLAPGRKIGVIVFDSRRLTESHLRMAGITGGKEWVVVRGLDGTRTWNAWMSPAYETDWGRVAYDTVEVAKCLCSSNPEVSIILMECAGLPPVADSVRRATGKPVYDWITLSNWLLSGARQ